MNLPQPAGRAGALFWSEVLGRPLPELPWRWVEIAAPEFLGRLVPPAGAPLEVLLQELSADDPGTSSAPISTGLGRP